jgi:hypothetical protein
MHPDAGLRGDPLNSMQPSGPPKQRQTVRLSRFAAGMGFGIGLQQLARVHGGVNLGGGE